jgi:hypothetical protein
MSLTYKEIHTAETILSGSCHLEVEIDIEMLMKYKSVGSD